MLEPESALPGEKMATPPAFDDPALDPLKEQLSLAHRILDHEGIFDALGHLSVRVPGADAFLTLARVTPRLASPENLILLDFDGRRFGGPDRPPYEWPIHAEILRARPDVQCVAHTHSMWSVVFGVLAAKPLRPVHQYATFMPPDGLPIYTGVGLVTTPELGAALATTLGDGAVALLRSHGDVVVGASVEETVVRTTRVAWNAQIQYLAEQAGEPHFIGAEDYPAYNRGPGDFGRPWSYFVDRLAHGDR